MSTTKPDLDGAASYSANPEDLFNRLLTTQGENDGLSQATFRGFLSELFTSRSPTCTVADLSTRAFDKFDRNKDGKLDASEFRACFDGWLTKVLRPKMALLVVDVQNDFIDGSLALRNAPAEQEGGDVIPVINKIIQSNHFDVVVYSMDWHPKGHCSFIENVSAQKFHPNSPITKQEAKVYDTVVLDYGRPVGQMLFPAHCVQDTPGAALHRDLTVVSSPDTVTRIIQKGVLERLECYSAFRDTQKTMKIELDEFLVENGVTDILVCGLTYDFCVGCTALDGLEFGYGTAVVEDATRGCDETRIAAMRDQLLASRCVFTTSSEVGDFLNGKVRLCEFAMQNLENR